MVENGNYTSKYNFVPEVQEYIDTMRLDKSIHTVRSYLSSLDGFFDFLSVSSMEDIRNINSADVRKYQSHLKNDGVQNSTINARIRCLKVIFNWFLNDGKIDVNPFINIKNLKEPKKQKSFLSEEEMNSMFWNGCKNTEDKAIFTFLISLGLRRAELVNLKVDDIVGSQVNVVGKGNKYRALFLTEHAQNLFQEHMASRRYESEYVFNKLGHKYTEEAIRQKIKAIAKRAGIDEDRVKEITPHTMRRTFATNLVASGVNMAVIQGSMGHANITTTMRYAHVRNSAIQNAMQNQSLFEVKE